MDNQHNVFKLGISIFLYFFTNLLFRLHMDLSLLIHDKYEFFPQQKAYEFSLRPRSVDAWSKNVRGTYKAHRLNTSVENFEGGIQSMVHSSSNDQTGTVVVHKDLNQESEDTTRQTRGESPSENHKVNGTLNVVPADRFIQLSSPSNSYISPGRFVTRIL